MKIYCFNLVPNPLPDFRGEFIPEPIALEIDDETILKIGDRYKELQKTYLEITAEMREVEDGKVYTSRND